MESEDLSISIQKITIRYVFRNTTNKDIDATVAFPLPDLNGGDVYNMPMSLPNERAVNFVQFAVTEKGKPIKTQMELRAFLEGKDITARLKSIGLPINVETEPLNAALKKLPQSTLTQLQKEELIVPDEYVPPATKQPVRQWFAMWTMRVQYYWTQRFPANSKVELVQTYRPVVGGSYITGSMDPRDSVEPYCGNAETVKLVRATRTFYLFKRRDNTLWEKRIDYILTTANNWKGPIGDFHLTVTTEAPKDIFVTCLAGLERTGPTRYELRKTNFRPDSELKLLILQADQPK